jgi:hypothetical protein
VTTRHLSSAAARMGRGVFLCALLLSLASGCKSKTAAAVDPLTLTPGESRMIVQVDVARLRQTQFKDRILQIINRSESFKKRWDMLSQKAGLDPMRDLDKITVAMPYQGDQGGSDAGAILYGRFKEPTFLAWFKGEAGGRDKETKYGNRFIYSDADGTYHLTFLKPTTLVIGSLRWVKQVLDLADGKGTSARATPALVSLVNRVKGNQVVWAVVTVPEQARTRAKEADSALKAVGSMVATIDFAAGMEIDFLADCDTDTDARILTDKFNSTVKELKESPFLAGLGFGTIMAQFKGSQEAKVFHAHGTMQQQQLDDLTKKLEEAFKAKMAEGGLPRIKLPTPEAGGPSSAPSSEGSKAGQGSTELPQLKLKLSPPGGAREKRRPSLLGK